MSKVGASLVGTRGRIIAARECVLTTMWREPNRAWTLDDLAPIVRRLHRFTAAETAAALRQLVTMRKVEVVVRGRAGNPGQWRVAS